ncbi:glucose-6-phosphate isomerase [Paraherbaspirillum soli]|uniref:Glucose-6-phosphate isomerase n=1 Tax=Paraherbaspirillum soli TaxID=631222 RepID=A0ABW0MAU2_9BURK
MSQSVLNITAAFQALQAHHAALQGQTMRDLFAADPARFERFSLNAAGLFLDYSKNKASTETMSQLFALARERQLESRRDAMFSGEKINTTEKRAVLHTALRAPATLALTVDGQQVSTDVHAVLARIQTFSAALRSGEWLGYSGQPLTDIVNIGIGGSDLGPKMVCQALQPFQHARLNMHFVSNVDGRDLDAVLSRIDPRTSLFVIASKTFTTNETMMNARAARNWFLQNAQGAQESDLRKHFVAVSTNVQAVSAFGIDPANMFPFWDWVGGRYSVWSSIGLSVALAIGFEQFSEFLAGAHAMDQHFHSAPLEQNMPVILAMLGVWYRNFFGSSSISIAPYLQDLEHFPSYLQQLEMESNGKRVSHDGSTLTVATCPVIWGNVGTNGQHAYFQLLHQGTDITPVDFIAALKPNYTASHELPGHQATLLANCFAQSEAFMRGKTADEVRTEMQAKGVPEADIAALLPHRTFPGDRPSNTILMQALTPATLGALIALYEHKVFVQGVIWDVNSFDQWGVELGKVLATQILGELTGAAEAQEHDSSTTGLIAKARAALL